MGMQIAKVPQEEPVKKEITGARDEGHRQEQGGGHPALADAQQEVGGAHGLGDGVDAVARARISVADMTLFMPCTAVFTRSVTLLNTLRMLSSMDI